MNDATFISKTADLLHLLKYAKIQTASAQDAVLANRLIQELQIELTRPRDHLQDFKDRAILSYPRENLKLKPIGWQFRFVFPTHKSNWKSVLELPIQDMKEGDGFRYETRPVYAPEDQPHGEQR